MMENYIKSTSAWKKYVYEYKHAYIQCQNLITVKDKHARSKK